MPEPSPAPDATLPVAAPRLKVRLGPAQRARRGAMAPEELCAAGNMLNGGRRRGWKKRLAQLLSTPETTIAAWASRSPGNARPVPGAVAVAVRLMADTLRQTMAQGLDHPAAAQALLQRVAALDRAAPGWPQMQPSAVLEATRPAAEASRPPPPEPILVEPPRRLAPGG
jgi:hypothetical protein